MRKRLTGMLITALACLALWGCEPSVTTMVVMKLVTPTPRPETVHLGVLPQEEPPPRPTLPPTPSPTPTPTPTPSPTPSPTSTPKATAKPKATATPKPKATATPKPKATATPRPNVTPEATVTSPASKPVDDEPIITAVPPEAQAPAQDPVQAPAQNVSTGYTEDYSVPAGVTVSGKYSAADISLAARVAAMEAGKNEEGYRAVLCVILNRVESGRWPDTVSGVCFQKNQFTVTKNQERFWNYSVPTKVYEYANDVFNNNVRLLETDVMSFRAARSNGDTQWGDREYVGTYGGNYFYR